MRKAIKTLAVTTLALTLALPFTAYAGTWQQDASGWKVRQDNGTYLTNQWYQSPESGLFYYIGADGYMLTSTTTPDGYQVGADGAWIQPDSTNNSNNTNQNRVPKSPDTQDNTNTGTSNTSGGYYIQPEIDWSQYDPEDLGGGGGFYHGDKWNSR